MNDWGDVQIFLALCRTASFARAAAQLAVDASTVSRRVAELERSLGCRLFERSTRAVALTDRAKRLLPHAEEIERAVVAMRREAAEPELAEGRVRVAAPEEIVGGVLVPALSSLLQAHPELRVDLIGAGALADLERGEADVALRVVRPEKGDLVSRRVVSVRYRAYASRSYLRGRSTDAPGDLEWLALDDPNARSPETHWVRAVCGPNGPRMRTNDTRALAVAAAAGHGAALLPEPIASRHAELTPLWPAGDAVLERTLWLVTPRKLARTARVRAVSRWMEEACRAAMNVE
jgi:DNA-binding transcriptional LysR family regulator